MLKNLKSELQEARAKIEMWKKDYFSKCNMLEKAEDKFRDFQEDTKEILHRQERFSDQQIDDLREIIRWLIKPSTAEKKYPKDKFYDGDILPRPKKW